MTTALPAPRSGAPVQLGVAAVLWTVGAALAGVTGLLVGSAAAWGVLIGTTIAAAVLVFGTATVAVIAALAPQLSLVVALLTYGLQLAMLLLALVAVERSGALEGEVSRTWLGATVIVGTVVWTAAQVVTTLRRRIPIYDLPEPDSARIEAGVR